MRTRPVGPSAPGRHDVLVAWQSVRNTGGAGSVFASFVECF
ncbi:MAG: hypothetical protein AAGH15_10465 [Myxococcota bacterium]